MPLTKPRSREARQRRAWTPAAPVENGTFIFIKPTLEHFVEFCAKLRLDSGHPFVVEPWQREVLTDYFDGVRETLLLLPSGNGKTTLYASLVLHHLLYTDSPEAFIVASSRDQAGRMHKHIVGFIARSKHLQRLVRPLKRTVELIHRPGSVEVLPADGDTVDGIGGTLTIGDEMHRWPAGNGVYAIAQKGLKKRQGQLLIGSTAGETMQSLLGRLRQRCLQLPNLTRRGMYTHGRAADGTLAYHEYALSLDDDAHDMKVVKQANPLSTITEKDLGAEHASMTWWEWARFACGLWVAGQHAAVSPLDWAACQHFSVEFQPDLGHLLTIDLAWVEDCTAINAVQAVSQRDVRLKKVAIVEPARDGTALREEQILSPIRQWKADNPLITGVVLDPEAGGRSLVEKLEDLDLEVIEHSQKSPAMCAAFKSFHGAIIRRVDDDDADSARVLQVESDPELTRHVLAAEAKTIEGYGSRLVKRRKNPEPIDGGVSAAMGVRVALGELDPDEATDQPEIEIWT